MTKRITALLLCLLMIVTMFPASVGSVRAIGIPACDCGFSGADGLTAHNDSCARKSYLRNTYIQQKSAAEIYDDWVELDAETREAVLTFLSWDNYAKYTQLQELLAGGEPGHRNTLSLNGVEVSQVTMPQFDKPTLSAATTLFGDVSYRWQILADAQTQFWVNIYGETSPELTLTYGMVASLLDSSNQAWVRCITTADGTEVASDALPVTLEPYVAPLRESVPLPAYVPAEEPSGPAEEPSEPTGEFSGPAEVPAEPTGESSGPAEEPAEPTGEASQPTEVPAEPTGESSGPAEVPAEPTGESSEPAEEPSETAEEPSEPTESVEVAADAAGDPSEPMEMPSAPAEEPPLSQEAMRMLPVEQRVPSSASAVEGEEGSSGELVQYDITVTYTFDSTGTTAAANYTASVAKGDPFNQTVTFPTVSGYEPYLYIDNSWVRQDSHTFNIPSVTEDVFMKVVYRPALVSYRVYVYLQNVDGNGYPTSPIQDSGLAYTGSTDYEFDQEHAKYPGFYQLPYEKPAIAADGSTTVSIYFDRYYYLMKFDQDGGYGAEPIYARYGTPLSVPTPTKAGYDFIGWDGNGDGKADALPATMPHENTSYKALWKEENTVKVTVVFWGENADDEQYSFLPDYTKEVYVKPGTSFTYSESADLVCGYDTEHTHSADCGYGCGLEAHDHSIENGCYTLTCPLENHSHSELCYTCNSETHNHTTNCYQNVGDPNNPWRGAPTNPEEGQVYTISFLGYQTSYIYIGGFWYSYSGDTTSGNIAPTTCGKTEQTHTHTEACIGCGKVEHTHSIDNNCYDMTPTCGKEVHVHSDLCYNCGIREHSHTGSCYLDNKRPAPELWTFVKSDTVTVKNDGTTVVNVYYDRKEFTLTFKKTGSNGTTLATIIDKWGRDIIARFQTICNANTFLWSRKTSGDSPWTSYLDIMPQENRTYYAKTSSSGSIQTATYYIQKPDGTGYTEYFKSNVKYNGNLTVSKEEFVEIEGYIFNESTSTKTGASYNGAKFYYDLRSFKLTFNNGLTDVRTETPMYGQSLDEYASYAPHAPDIYEPGSVEFDGWYQNPECTGDEYILSAHTMPANDLLLYAKWKQASHTVRVFPSAEDAQNQTNQIGETQVIPHGSMAVEPDAPKNEPYQFVGWFYTAGGVEYAFDFEDMPVVRDLDLYAKWSSTVMVDYTVRYLKDGTTESIAPDTTGSGLAGYDKTFEAVEAPDGWFPLVKSHSLTLDLDAAKNVCTFYYVQKPSVPYTVRYVTIIDGEERDLSTLDISGAPAAKTISDNKKAVVTENFVPVPGYLPDAFQKTLVVSADGKDNVITFVYTKDEVNSYYIVSDWLQNTDGTTWTRNIREEGPGKIGTHYEREPQTIPGFTYDAKADGTQTSGTLKKDTVLELNFYYKRNKYPYQIRYLEYGTEKVLADPVTYTGEACAYYGEAVNAEGQQIPTIDGYRLHSVVGCTIGIETNVENLYQNVVKVYYVPVTGDLQISKQINVLNDNAPNPSDQEFEFVIAVPEGVTGTYPVTIGESTENVSVTDGTLKVCLKGGESATIRELPQGPSTNKHQYTITETPVPGFNSSFSPSSTATVSAGTDTTVTCTNEYPVGDLVITKTVKKEYDGDTWDGAAFDFTVNSGDLPETGSYLVKIGNADPVEYQVENRSILLKDVTVSSETPEVTIRIENVPAGSYTVAEKETDVLKAAYITTANGTEGYLATVDVTASKTPAAANFVNTFMRTTGDLHISKEIQIVPDSGATLDPDAEFTFTIQMPNNLAERYYVNKTYTVTGHSTITAVTPDENKAFTFKLKHGEHLIIEDLPVGSYVVTEAPAAGYASSFPAPNPVDGSVSETVTITTDAQTELKCINTYPVHVGNLKITKTVQNESGLANVPEDTFPFKVEFTVMGNNLTFPVTHSSTDTTETLTAVRNGNKAVLTVQLKDGESVLIEKLPEGNCTVTEVNIPVNYTAEYPGSITIAPDQTQTLAVVNKYKPPALTIVKTGAEAGQVFVYEVKDNTTGEIITVTVTGNSSTTIHNLTPGRSYTITQKNGWSWRYGDPAQTVTLPANGDTVTFSGGIQKDSWLDGNSELEKNQKAGG